MYWSSGNYLIDRAARLKYRQQHGSRHLCWKRHIRDVENIKPNSTCEVGKRCYFTGGEPGSQRLNNVSWKHRIDPRHPKQPSAPSPGLFLSCQLHVSAAVYKTAAALCSPQGWEQLVRAHRWPVTANAVPLNAVLRSAGDGKGTFAARRTLWICTCIYFSPYAITYFTDVAFIRDQDKKSATAL